MYTAAVLTPQACNQLKQILAQKVNLEGYLFHTAAGMPLPHHMTINMNQFDSSLNDPSLLGQDCSITVDGLSFNNTLGICAARVSRIVTSQNVEIKSVNSQKHITVAIKATSKPFFSNKLLWKTEGDDFFIPISPINLQAKIEECQ